MPRGRQEPYRGAFGPNAWLVDDIYEQYRRDPSAVSESWREFFADRSSGGPQVAAPATTEARPLGGRQAVMAANMEASLAVPTATSVRPVPAKLLEVNRAIVNEHLSRTSGGKVSFTHLIAYAVVQAVVAVPAMNATFVADVDGSGTPGVVRHRRVGLGVAVDTVRPDRSRSLVVPCIHSADTADFRSFWLAYEELLRKVRTRRATADDFSGTTVTLTNPGTLGTVQSVPRLMAGQGLIVGVGAIDWPVEYQAADLGRLADMGVSKVVNITSTYDHRIIQGAESGLFLARVGELLLGKDGFYDEVFRSLAVPYEPARWSRDSNPVDGGANHLQKQVHVQTLINMYRVRGHLIADLDPLGMRLPHFHSELDPATYGLTLWDLDREFFADHLGGAETLTLDKILTLLRDAYCRTTGLEYMHIQDPEQKRWLQAKVEGAETGVDEEEQARILERLNAAEAFERFLHTRYVGQKRFGLEGGESAIVVLGSILDASAEAGLEEAVMGMAHRGRLNVLANIVGKSYGEIFREFEGDLDPDSVQGSGDVKYHKGASGKFVSGSGAEIPVTLASNPSHLEAVGPVVEGMARARRDMLGEGWGQAILPLVVHGDAAFAGQGVVAETLNLSDLKGYRTGGTVHLVINNQVGFTTAPEAARSSVYPTDVAKMVQAPIFHVNGDDPEACARVGRLAFEFRQAFRKDVVIDVVCYRRFGHNEGDEPSFTQPQMYDRIERKRSVRKLYTEALINRGDLTIEEAERALDDFSAKLQSALEQTRSSAPPRPTVLPPPPLPADDLPSPPTGVEKATLDCVAASLHRPPDRFVVHPKLSRQLETRAAAYESGEVDWALAEALAMGSLLLEGTDVRLAGQDTRRGTFSQRHAALVDYRSGIEWIPLAHLDAPGRCPSGEGRQGQFHVVDSLLSEYAALGFEYGYSVVRPDALVAWEAQFGDFSNVGQVVIDEFVVSAADKWGQRSGLVLLLPHGYEGQGPDHSSARLERFLVQVAGDNLAVAVPSTAAQYFHLLRSQARRQGQRPLEVLTPKSLLRARHARSRVSEFVDGRFLYVLDDPSPPQQVRSVVLCSGKVGYDAIARRDSLAAAGAPASSAAVVRLEQLYPWPSGPLAEVLARYPDASEVVWLQEEPENMGGWSFAHRRLHHVLPDGVRLRAVARAPSGSPATGSAALHALETQDLLSRTFPAL